MATDSRNVVFLQTTDAEFRTWVAAVKASLIATGLTQTSDTGQIDTATVTKPGAINTAQGYVIFRFNDTAHSTVPIFMKVEFGAGSAVTVPMIWLTTTSSTDGAGTMTGTSYRARTTLSFGTANSTSWPMRACYNTEFGIFWMHLMNGTSINTGGMLYSMRSCDIDTGDATTDAIASQIVSNNMGSIPFYDIAISAVRNMNSFLGASGYSSSTPVLMHEGRITCSAGSTILYSGKIIAVPGLCAAPTNNLVHDNPVYITLWGVERTYLPLVLGVSPLSIVTPASSGNDSGIWIWE